MVLPLAPSGADDELEPVRPDHRLLVFRIFAEDDVVSLPPRLSFDQRDQVDALQDGRAGNSQQVANGRENINQLREVDNALPLGQAAGPAEDQGHSHRRLIKAVLLEAAMLPEHVTVVAQEDDQGVAAQSALVEARSSRPIWASTNESDV